MRILSILPYSPPSLEYGGAERQMHSLHLGLLQRGVDIHVLADINQVGCSYQEVEGVPVWGVPFPTLTAHPLLPGNLRFWQDWRVIRGTVLHKIPRPDLIQVSTFRQPALVGYWLSQLLNVPWIVRLAGSGKNGDLTFAGSNWLSRIFLPKMVKSVSHVVALDNETSTEIRKAGVSNDRVDIINNGLVVRNPKMRKAKEFWSQPLTILYLGRLAEPKKVETLLMAFSKIIDHNIFSCRLRIVGAGDQASKLQNLAHKLGIISRCDFVGATTRPEEELELAHCLVNPSESEGLPNAVIEAAAFGLPLILSDIPVHRQIAQNVGMVDYLFPVSNVDTLVLSIKRFIALNIEQKSELSSQCTLFSQSYTSESRDLAYLKLYHNVLASSSNSMKI